MNKNVVLITPVFPPEIYMSASMIAEMAEELVKRKYNVLVLTTIPSRPQGKTFFQFKTKPFVIFEQSNGYKLIRVRSWQLGPKRSKFNRIMENLVFGIITGCILLFLRHTDYVISIPWPNICAFLQVMAAKIRKIPYYYYIMDLMPEQAESAGIMKPGSFTAQSLLWLDKVACRWSAGIFTLSDGLKKHISISREVPLNKILLTTIQVNVDLLKPIVKDDSWREQLKIPNDAKVVLYSGTLGYVSGIDMMVDVVRQMPETQKVVFLIIGEGPLAGIIKKLAIEYSGKIKYLPFQPTEVFQSILHVVDITLVTMNPRSGIGSVPSKIYSYMAAGKPIFAAVPLDSEVYRLISALDCGKVSTAFNPAAILNTINEMITSEHLGSMGARGKKFVERYCNVKNNVDHIVMYWKRGNIEVEKDA